MMESSVHGIQTMDPRSGSLSKKPFAKSRLGLGARVYGLKDSAIALSAHA
jgi:hypothetical protein